MRAGAHQMVQLAVLRKLGLPEAQVGQIRDQLHRTDQLAVNGQGQVALGALEAAARAVEAQAKRDGQRFAPLPAAQLRQWMAPVPGDSLAVGRPADFPVATVEADSQINHADSLDRAVDAKVFTRNASAVSKFLEKEAPALAAAFAEGTATVGDLARALGTDAALSALGREHEAVLAALGTVGGPAYSARDLTVNLDSRWTHLDGGLEPGSVGVFQKRMIEHLTVNRNAEPGSFTVHGFEQDKVVVTVPKGATLVLLNEAGDQSGATLRPELTTIQGEKHQAVTISRSLVQPPERKTYATDPAFAVRVIGADGEVLYERNLRFDSRDSQRSKQIFSGRVSAQPASDASLSDLWDHYVPDRKQNAVPVGERPRFSLDDQPEGDRIRIARDGQTFDLGRWVQFLAPPRHGKQVFKLPDRFLELHPANSSRNTLDDAEYEPTAGARLRTSTGHAVTFDRALHQTAQAHWGARGVQIFDAGMRRRTGLLDPLHGARG